VTQLRLDREEYAALYEVFQVPGVGNEDLVAYREFVKFLDDTSDSQVFEVDQNGHTNARQDDLDERDWQEVEQVLRRLQQKLGTSEKLAPRLQQLDPKDHGHITPIAFIDCVRNIAPSAFQSARDEELLAMRFQKGYTVDYKDFLQALSTGVVKGGFRSDGARSAVSPRAPGGCRKVSPDPVQPSRRPIQGPTPGQQTGSIGGFQRRGTETRAVPDRAPEPTGASHTFHKTLKPVKWCDEAREAHDSTLVLQVGLKAKVETVDMSRFLDALAQQIGADRRRITVKKTENNMDPCNPGSKWVLHVAEGCPTNVAISQNAKGIMSRSQRSHRYIGGYAVITMSCQAGAPLEVGIESLIHRIRSKTWRDRIRIREFFEQHDRLRCRKCSKTKMRTSMSQMGFTLTPEEFYLLEQEFGDAAHPDSFNYDHFSSAVDCIFTEGDLEKHPDHEPREFVPNPRKWDHHGGRMEPAQLTGPEGLKLYRACMRIAQECHRKRIDMEAYFKEYDRRHWSMIDAGEFKSTLNLLNLEASHEEIAIILKRFSVPGPEVNYEQFVDYCNQLCDMKPPPPTTTTTVY